MEKTFVYVGCEINMFDYYRQIYIW